MWKWFIFVSCVIFQSNPIFVTFDMSCEATEPDRLDCYLHLEDQLKPSRQKLYEMTMAVSNYI